MVREVLHCYDHDNHSNHSTRRELSSEWYIQLFQKPFLRNVSWSLPLWSCIWYILKLVKVYMMVPEELLAHLFACLETSGLSKIRFLMKYSWRVARFLYRQFHAAQQKWLECLLWSGIVWSYSDLQSWSEILSSESSQSMWSYIYNV